ncbi:DUF2065 domain-containing protein [Elioraea tepida]|uniref:DUF2065 domain-containing protein n=1 Tax=Elioraea tepida TaxID=2843330 RepID=A0A975YKJ6_9PROT|nr:DUF2065 family protein [Elioraea tepida]QXM25537.1 DUF2065 domain-containing protein [Elioraea tepida]
MSVALLLAALGLVIAAEGLLYAAFPAQVRRALAALLSLEDGALRAVGVAAATLGLLIVALASLLV